MTIVALAGAVNVRPAHVWAMMGFASTKSHCFVAIRPFRWLVYGPRRRRIISLLRRKFEVVMAKVARGFSSGSKATAYASRRRFLSRALGLSLLPAALSAWKMRPTPRVIFRDGWVLSKDD
jgi:hypothetical protein